MSSPIYELHFKILRGNGTSIATARQDILGEDESEQQMKDRNIREITSLYPDESVTIVCTSCNVVAE